MDILHTSNSETALQVPPFGTPLQEFEPQSEVVAFFHWREKHGEILKVGSFPEMYPKWPLPFLTERMNREMSCSKILLTFVCSLSNVQCNQHPLKLQQISYLAWIFKE